MSNILTDKERVELACRIAFEFAFSGLRSLSEYGANSWAELYDRCQEEDELFHINNEQEKEETLLCEAYDCYDIATALDMTYELADYATSQYEEAMLARNQLTD